MEAQIPESVAGMELGVCTCKLFTAEAKYNSGVVAEAVLPVIVTIGGRCQEVFGLKRTNRDVSRDPYIDPPAGSHRECA